MRLAVGCALALLAACVQIEPFPQSWGSLEQAASDCRAVAGTYLNRGETSDGKEVELAVWLVRYAPTGRTAEERSARQQFYKDLAAARLVQIAMPGAGLLTIRAFGGQRVDEWGFDEKHGEWACEETGRVLITRRGGVSGIGGMGVESRKRSLYRAGRYLFLDDRIGGAGMVLLVPIATYETRWARFPSAQ